MTRPKRMRQAAQNPFRNLPVLQHVRVPLTPKFAVEITLYDGGGVYPISCVWDPHKPSNGEMAALAERLAEELTPFYVAAFRLSGAMADGGAS